MNKADITSALVSRLLAAQFPQWAHLPVTPVEIDGWDNTTFRLGVELSVRLPSADVYIAQVEKEQRWLPLLAPHPTPHPRTCGEGRPQLRLLAAMVGLAADLADFLAALYAIDSTDGPVAGEHNFFRGGPLTTYDRDTSRRSPLSAAKSTRMPQPKSGRQRSRPRGTAGRCGCAET
jgi:aminoglycoside phosphotransferase (APT) family kinase protein